MVQLRVSDEVAVGKLARAAVFADCLGLENLPEAPHVAVGRKLQ